MAKTKTPFLSLGASGTVADTLTSQKGSSSSVLRSKPTPTDRHTLPQTYQRWLYEDYAYLWRQQSLTTRATYRSAGVRHHLTGFQYWMKYHLTNLPDIIGIWRLDQRSGAVVPDTSRNSNHGTLFGPSYITGRIAQALHFDGLNDRVLVPYSPSIATTPKLSVLLWIRTPAGFDFRVLLSRTHPVWEFGIYGDLSGIPNTLDTFIGGTHHRFAGTFGTNYSKWVHVAFTFSDADNELIHYVNGINVRTFATAKQIPLSTNDLEFARRLTSVFWYKDDLDHVEIYNRVLDPTEILRHAERSYPQQ